MGRIFKTMAMGTMAAWLGTSALAQGVPPQQIDSQDLPRQLEDAMRAAQRVDMAKIQEQMAAAERAMEHVDLSQIGVQMDRARMQLDMALPQINLSLDQIGAGGLNLGSMLAFAPFQSEQADR